MPSERSSDVKFDIGHVLFIDIVRLLEVAHKRAKRVSGREIVLGTEQCRLAEAEGKLLRLPTGDGGALVFRTSPDEPVKCAVEIRARIEEESRAMRAHGDS